METINTKQKLTLAIETLSLKQTQEWKELKEESVSIYQQMMPLNILKSTFAGFLSPSPNPSLVNTALAVSSGFLAKKLFVGETTSQYKKLLGSLLEILVSSTLVKKTDEIISLGKSIVDLVRPKQNSEKTIHE